MFYKVIFFYLYLFFSNIIYSIDEESRVDSYLMYLINNQQWNNDINIEYTTHFYLYLYRMCFFSLTENKWDDRVKVIYLDDKDPFVCLPFIGLFACQKKHQLKYFFKMEEKNIAPSKLPKALIRKLHIEKFEGNISLEYNKLIWNYNELLYLFYLNVVHISLQYKLYKSLRVNTFCQYEKNDKQLEFSEYVANISVLRMLLYKETAENFIVNEVKNKINNSYENLFGSEKKIIEIASKTTRTREDYIEFSYVYINYLNRKIIEEFRKKVSALNDSEMLNTYERYLVINQKLFRRKIDIEESLDSMVMYVFDELNMSKELPVINFLKNTRSPFTKIVKGLDNMINDKEFFDDNEIFLYKIWFYISLGLSTKLNIFSFKKLFFGFVFKVYFEDFIFLPNASLYFRIQFPDLINNYIKYVSFYVFKLYEKNFDKKQLLNFTCLINAGDIRLFQFVYFGCNLGINVYKDICNSWKAKFVFELSLLN